MKLLHVSDIHLGKRVGGISMIPEQLAVIDQLGRLALDEGVRAVLIAGDVFDRPVASREALEACERLFSAFIDNSIPVFVVPGNHDLPQQLAFCSAFLASSGLHIAKAFDGSIERFELEEDGQHVCIHLLPFVRPTDVRMALREEDVEVDTYDDAVRLALATDHIAEGACNVLVAHQFVTAGASCPELCDSEVVSLGGTDNVDASLFDSYDYVALGHLHGAQHVGRPTIRYSGSPLKYSFSEAGHDKSATLVTIEDGTVKIDTRPLRALHDMREITASYEELLGGFDAGDTHDYMHVTLTDRSLPDAMAKLRALYPNIMRLDWEAYEASAQQADRKVATMEALSAAELFAQYVEQQLGTSLTPEERLVVEQCVEEARS